MNEQNAIVTMDASAARDPGVAGTHGQFVARWSPRAMAGEALALDDIAPLFEAARWAPSAFNAQPWRFLFSLRGDEHWHKYLDLLVPGNMAWASGAGALVVVVSRSKFEMNDNDSLTHSFDTGAAWMSLALQAHHAGLVAHGMQGFDYAAARQVLAIPEPFVVEAMIAIGRPGQVASLPEGYREREQPSGRKPLAQIAMNGVYSAS